jgi:gliding motility associated protien GldN
MKKIIASVLALAISNAVLAQAGSTNGVNLSDPPTSAERLQTKDTWMPSLVKDGIIDRVPHVGKVTPWQPIRENDVLYRKKVWREIDTRQKQNFAFRYPGDDETGGGTFIEILLNGIKKGTVTAYTGSDDRFTGTVSFEDVMSSVTGKADTVEIFDPGTQTYIKRIKNNDFKPENVTRFRIKEEVIFDRTLGREVRRILGICPILDKYDDEGLYKGTLPIFWLYYPDLRNQLVRYEVYNPDNDLNRLTWDDFFEKRMFSSYITKTNINNPDDALIRDYKSDMDKLYESEKNKEMLFNKEHDLWVY